LLGGKCYEKRVGDGGESVAKSVWGMEGDEPELGAVGVEKEGQMDEDGQRLLHCLVYDDVLGRRRQPLFTANDVGDAHVHVVDDTCEMVAAASVNMLLLALSQSHQ